MTDLVVRYHVWRMRCLYTEIATLFPTLGAVACFGYWYATKGQADPAELPLWLNCMVSGGLLLSALACLVLIGANAAASRCIRLALQTESIRNAVQNRATDERSAVKDALINCCSAGPILFVRT